MTPMLVRDHTIDYAAEFAEAASRAQRHHFLALQRLGVPKKFLWAGAMRFGVANILTDGVFYQPGESGIEAMIVPAAPLPALDDDVDDDVLHDAGGDIVAFEIAAPARWWRRTGAAPILNEPAVGRAVFTGRPLAIHANPLDWLRASGDGIVVLDRAANLRFWLQGVREIVADTIELGEEIDRRLREAAPRLPRVLVRETAAE